ncbi:MAG: hypothetical protein CMJ32_00055 [Phycisphaerae bacterium]|nr:hypothetical protein [Phycisphaerae bacterium]
MPTWGDHHNDNWPSDWPEDGRVGGSEVILTDAPLSEVLGPDGEPVRRERRHAVGFDLSRRDD